MFTKGPWHKQELKTGIGIMLGEPPSPEKRYIPIVLAIIPAEIGGYEEERQANAHLIAASPIMHDYILKKAEEGDEDAKSIIANIWPAS